MFEVGFQAYNKAIPNHTRCRTRWTSSQNARYTTEWWLRGCALPSVPTGKTKRGRRQAVLDDDAGAKKEKDKTNIHHYETRH